MDGNRYASLLPGDAVLPLPPRFVFASIVEQISDL